MQKKIISVLIALCLVFTLVPTAFAGGADTTPPRLISVSVDKTSYVSGESVTVTVEAVDDESGLSTSNGSSWVLVSGANKSQYIQLSLVEGSVNTYTGSLDVNNNFPTGEYCILEMGLRDNAQNYRRYYKLTEQSGDIDTFTTSYFSVTNTARTDWEAPTVQSLTIDKTEANVGDTITFEATAQDPSGVEFIFLSLAYEDVRFSDLHVYLLPVEGKPGLLRGSLAVSSDLPEAVYSILKAYVNDDLGNTNWVDAALTEQIIFKINNPDLLPNLPRPIIKNVTFLKDKYKPGEYLEVALDIETYGNRLKDEIQIYIENGVSGGGFTLGKTQKGTFRSDYPVYDPIKESMQPGLYEIRIVLYHKDSTCTQYWKSCGDYIFPKLQIVSVFTGTDNVSLPLGAEPFDPKAGVTAANETEGDMTSRIEVTGNVDTDTPGLYLLKYRIKNSRYSPYDYYESRWIGVTEAPATSGTNPNAPLALTNSSLTIGASSSEATIQKDGKPMAFTTQISDAGEYTVSLSGDTGTSGYGASYGAEADSDTVKAVIDRSGPQISTVYNTTAMNTYNVKVSASDPSGVVEMRWMKGNHTAAECKSAGTVVLTEFTAIGSGEYTLYARDGFGYETVKAVKLSATKTNHPYLNNITVDKSSLTRTFNYKYYSYTVNIGENDDGLTITPEKADPDATMTIQGATADSKYIHVDIGRSVKVPIKIKSGKLSKTYYVTVKRAKSTNNELSGLTLSIGNEGLTYDAATLTYTLQMNKDTPSVRVTPVKSSGLAKVCPGVKTYKVKNGKSLKVKITVTAQSGARKTYWLIITRANI